MKEKGTVKKIQKTKKE